MNLAILVKTIVNLKSGKLYNLEVCKYHLDI